MRNASHKQKIVEFSQNLLLITVLTQESSSESEDDPLEFEDHIEELVINQWEITDLQGNVTAEYSIELSDGEEAKLLDEQSKAILADDCFTKENSQCKKKCF